MAITADSVAANVGLFQCFKLRTQLWALGCLRTTKARVWSLEMVTVKVVEK